MFVQADGAKTAFAHLRVIVQATAECKAPSQQDLMKFADPIVKASGSVTFARFALPQRVWVPGGWRSTKL